MTNKNLLAKCYSNYFYQSDLTNFLPYTVDQDTKKCDTRTKRNLGIFEYHPRQKRKKHVTLRFL